MNSLFDVSDPRQAALRNVFEQPMMPGSEMAERFLLPLFDESIHYRLLPPSLPLTIDLNGISAVREQLPTFVTILKQIELRAEHVVAGATDVVVFAQSRGILLNDAPFTNSYAIRFAFDSSCRVTEMDEFVDAIRVAEMMASLASKAPAE